MSVYTVHMPPCPHAMPTPLRLPTLKTTFSILPCHSGLEADDNIQTPGHYGPLSSMAKFGTAKIMP